MVVSGELDEVVAPAQGADLSGGTTSVLLPAINTPITQGRSPEIRWGNGVFIINLSADAAGEQSYLMVSEAGTMTAAPRIAPKLHAVIEGTLRRMEGAR